MSPKELLYIEDALGREQVSQTICSDSVDRLQDQKLKDFARQLCMQHQQTFEKFYGLI